MANRTCEPDLTTWQTPEAEVTSFAETLSGRPIGGLARLAYDLFRYGAPIITVPGLLGNFASFVVMTSGNMRHQSTSVYLSVLAIGDTMALLYLMTIYWYADLILHRKFQYDSDVLCKLEPIFKRFTICLAAYMIVCVSVERWFVTSFPFRASSICTPKTAKIVVTSVTLSVAAFSIGVVLQFGIGPGECMYDGYYNYFFIADTKWILTVVYSFIPIAILVLVNATTAIVLQVRNHASMSSATPDPASEKSMKQTTKATKVVLIVATCYIIFTMPSTICIPILRDAGLRGELTEVDTMVFYVSYLSLLLNHGINFFLYVMISERFRKTFLGFFRCGSGMPAKPSTSTSDLEFSDRRSK